MDEQGGVWTMDGAVKAELGSGQRGKWDEVIGTDEGKSEGRRGAGGDMYVCM